LHGILSNGCWRGTPRLTSRRRKVAGSSVLVAGDAAGYVEPFTGEGIAWALAGGAVAGHLAGTIMSRPLQEIERAWQREHQRLVRSRQLICRIVTTVLRRPLLTRCVIRLLNYLPDSATPVMRMMSRPVPLAFL